MKPVPSTQRLWLTGASRLWDAFASCCKNHSLAAPGRAIGFLVIRVFRSIDFIMAGDYSCDLQVVNNFYKILAN